VPEVEKVKVPNIGGATDVDVIEVMVKAGDEVEAQQSIVTLESDKASMEVPSPLAGKVEAVEVKVGDKVSKGDKLAAIYANNPAAIPTCKALLQEAITYSADPVGRLPLFYDVIGVD